MSQQFRPLMLSLFYFHSVDIYEWKTPVISYRFQLLLSFMIIIDVTFFPQSMSYSCFICLNIRFCLISVFYIIPRVKWILRYTEIKIKAYAIMLKLSTANDNSTIHWNKSRGIFLHLFCFYLNDVKWTFQHIVFWSTKLTKSVFKIPTSGQKSKAKDHYNLHVF